MPDEKPLSIQVTKLDAARRQIEAAIALWFHGSDPVSIRTLTAAAHRICHDIAKHRGGKSPFFLNLDFILPEMREKYKKLILEAENFFKHAERDRDKTLTFFTEVNEPYLIDAIALFKGMHGDITPLMGAFWFRFFILNSDLSGDFSPIRDELLTVYWRQLSSTAFLEKFLESPPALWGS